MFRKLFSKMAKVTINGMTFSGDNLNIVGRNIYVDGQLVDVNLSTGQQELEIKVTEGILGTLRAGGSVECGEVHGDIDAGSSVHVTGSVGQAVDAGSSVNVGGDIGGDVDAGSSVTVNGNVRGNIDAGGSVRVGSR